MRISSEIALALIIGTSISGAVLVTGCADRGFAASHKAIMASDGPANQGPKLPVSKYGDAAAGRDIFRYATFGNEGFWTDAMRLPAGMMAAKVTPMQLMKLGVSVDVDSLDATTLATLKQQLKQDPSGRSSALLHDPKTTIKWINANAIIGMPIKDSNGDGVMDITKGDKAGVSCSLCHTITDGSVFQMHQGGSIGHREDGRTNHFIDLGKILATAANSRAFYPMLQLQLKANKGKTFGRAPQGLTADSTEAEVDAYLSNPKYYPVGMFDDSPDGNGDSMRIQPLFRQDLAGPYGTGGSIGTLDNFSNLVYTVLFDETSLTTPGGRAFLHALGGPAGDEIANNYVKVLAATGVKGYPYVKDHPYGKAGTDPSPAGVRVNEAKLLNLSAYMKSLPAPEGAKVDAEAASHGRQLFRTKGCTSCHNVDQSKPVPTFIVPMKQIFPGFDPVVLAQRKPPLDPIEHTPGSTFDLKMAIINASLRGGKIRGTALPLLLDLKREPFYLHDDSVPSLDDLLNPKRGPKAPHPFYLSNSKNRANMVMFLQGLGPNSQAGK